MILDKGVAIGKDADFALVTLPDKVEDTQSIALQTILHTQKVTATYIDGKLEFSVPNKYC
jgi:cytosine/adenosine deaminase-related metal-dependent hydrolase